MKITLALIGRKPCLDQAFQTQKLKLLSREFLLIYKTSTLWFLCLDDLMLRKLLELRKARKITRLPLVFRALFLTIATFPRVWIRSSKHGNHKVIV